MNTQEFIKKAIAVHGDRYDYSKTEYINYKSSVTIICKKHGEFKQGYSNHIRGRGCSKCSYLNKRMSTDEFIKKARHIHGNRYDYSKVEYSKSNIKILIICKEHGEFWQVPGSHLSKNGCPTCSPKNHQATTNDFIKKAVAVHGDKYDYSKTVYEKCNKKIKIVCKKHGEFTQLPHSHTQGTGCPSCKHSKGEQLIYNWLSLKKVKFIPQKTFDGFNSGIRKKPYIFDFYLPDHNLIIEYDGMQHFKYYNTAIFNKNLFIKTKRNDLIKNKFCVKHNINLLRIPYTEFKRIDKILESILSKPAPASNILPFFTNTSKNKTTLEEAGVLSM